VLITSGGQQALSLLARALVRPGDRVRQQSHDRLLQALARELPTWKIRPVPGGQTLWARLPRGDGASFAQVALRHGVAVLPGSGLDATGGGDLYLRLHFILPADQLDEGVHRLAAAWRDYQPALSRAGGARPRRLTAAASRPS
jgi:DNA-binding transcriptional MocR family regulator